MQSRGVGDSNEMAMTMREITGHKASGLNEALQILVLDEPGSDGASNKYAITARASPGLSSFEKVIDFQDGPIAEVGVNGISDEALLAIVADRLKCFQAGPYSCRENAIALAKIQEALDCLQSRTPSGTPLPSRERPGEG